MKNSKKNLKPNAPCFWCEEILTPNQQTVDHFLCKYLRETYPLKNFKRYSTVCISCERCNRIRGDISEISWRAQKKNHLRRHKILRRAIFRFGESLLGFKTVIEEKMEGQLQEICLNEIKTLLNWHDAYMIHDDLNRACPICEDRLNREVVGAKAYKGEERNGMITYAISAGNPFDGMTLYLGPDGSPFGTDEQARIYAEQHFDEDEWAIVPLYIAGVDCQLVSLDQKQKDTIKETVINSWVKSCENKHFLRDLMEELFNLVPRSYHLMYVDKKDLGFDPSTGQVLPREENV